MRSYTNSSYAAMDMQTAAEKLGVWALVGALEVSVRLGPTHAHFGGGQHELVSCPDAQDVLLKDLDRSWCGCLTRVLVDPYSGFPNRHQHDLVLRMVSLVVREHYLQVLCDSYEEKVLRSKRERLVVFTNEGTSSWYARTRALAYPDGSRQGQAELGGALDTFESSALARAKSLLLDPQSNHPARVRALKKLVQRTYMVSLERDDSELLVGFAGTGLESNRAFPELLRDVMSTSLVFGDSTREFFRLPAYAYCFLERNLNDQGLGLQAAPWDDTVELSELAELWSPWERSALCVLGRAVETLRLV